MFDCIIASPLKRDFSIDFEKLLSEIQDDDIETLRAKVGYVAFHYLFLPEKYI